MKHIELFSLYQSIEELQKDWEQGDITKVPPSPYLVAIQPKMVEYYGRFADMFIEDVLYLSMCCKRPWEGLNCVIEDYRSVFYSNALACALLTFKYLSAEEVTFEELLCDPQKGESAKNNKAVVAQKKAMQKKVKKIGDDRENDKILKLMYPCDYLPPLDQEKVKNFLAPVIREIAADMEETDDGGEGGRSKNINQLLLDIERKLDDYRRNREFPHYGVLDDSEENDNQRQRKKRLRETYRTFLNALNGAENDEHEEARWSEYVMKEFAREMIYHRRAIIEFEKQLSVIKISLAERDKETKTIIEKDILRKADDFTARCKIPIVFHSDKVIFLGKNPCNTNYLGFLRMIIVTLYEYAGRNVQTAYKLLSNYVDEKPFLSPGEVSSETYLFNLRKVEIDESVFETKRVRVFALETIIDGFSRREIYTPIGMTQADIIEIVHKSKLRTGTDNPDRISTKVVLRRINRPENQG